MSLKNDYLTGPSGLEQNVALAFQDGVNFIGTGVSQVVSLFMGDRNGSNLGAGSSVAGTYFDIDGPSAGYRVWIYVNGEVAPANAGRTLVQATVLVGDNSTQAATDIANALKGIAANDFSVSQIGGSLQITNNGAKAGNPLTLGPSGWGTASSALVTAGVNATGNYAAVSTGLKNMAAMGRTQFVLTFPAVFTSTCNVSALRANNGNNLILKAYFAGIVYAFASEAIYDYEIRPVLNVSDRINTNVDLHFNFSYNQANNGRHELNNNPLSTLQTNSANNVSGWSQSS